MEEGPFKKSEEQKIEQLRELLRPIFQDGYSTLGHGTNEYAAQNVLHEGLIVSRYYDLGSVLVSLFDQSKTYEEQSAETFSQILHWPHKDLKYIVVVLIPNPGDGQTAGLNYFNGVLEETDHEKWGKKQIVSPKFIKGYIDANTLRFIENDLYDKDAKVHTTQPEQKSLAQGKVRSDSNKNVAVPTPSIDTENESKVW